MCDQQQCHTRLVSMCGRFCGFACVSDINSAMARQGKAGVDIKALWAHLVQGMCYITHIYLLTVGLLV